MTDTPQNALTISPEANPFVYPTLGSYSFALHTSSFSYCLFSDNRLLLKITSDGNVETDSLEDASEAGKVFVESVRYHLKQSSNIFDISGQFTDAIPIVTKDFWHTPLKIEDSDENRRIVDITIKYVMDRLEETEGKITPVHV